jgi:uncharacterized membrane protein
VGKVFATAFGAAILFGNLAYARLRERQISARMASSTSESARAFAAGYVLLSLVFFVGSLVVLYHSGSPAKG